MNNQTNIINSPLTIGIYPFRSTNSCSTNEYNFSNSHPKFLVQSSKTFFRKPNLLQERLTSIANYFMHFKSLVEKFGPGMPDTIFQYEHQNVIFQNLQQINQGDKLVIKDESICGLELTSHSNIINPVSQKNCSSKRKKSRAKNFIKTKSIQKKKKKFWLPGEDALLLELMEIYGEKWTKISTFLQDRTGKQVRDRYLNYLRPTIKQRDWTEEEDNLLKKLSIEFGNKWSSIAVYLHGRTENQVKNRYYALIRRSKKVKLEKMKSCKIEPDLEKDLKIDSDYDNNIILNLKSEPSSTLESISSNFECKTNQDNQFGTFPFQSPQMFLKSLGKSNGDIKVEQANLNQDYTSFQIKVESNCDFSGFQSRQNDFIEAITNNFYETKGNKPKKREKLKLTGLPYKKVKVRKDQDQKEMNNQKQAFV